MADDQGRAIKILDVNDDKGWSDFFKEYLEGRGWQVVTASDGDEGVVVALRELPDLILMNYLMGRMDGLQATRLLREYPHMRGVPVILYSACDEEWLRPLALEAGCTDFLASPFGFKDACRMIKFYCRARRAHHHF